METNGLSGIGKNLGGFISKNSPTILTSIAVGGLFTTVILAVKATPKALILLEEERKIREENKENGENNPITKLDAVRLTWSCYIPSCAIGLATIACIIGANSINLRRSAALASVYSLTETAFKEYKSKVVETIGKGKELKVRDEIDADHIKQVPSNSTEIIITGKGDVICFDTLSGRYFKNDIEKIRRAINELNRGLMSEMFVTLNEFYYTIGLPTIKLGDDMGWDVEKGFIEINFGTQLTENGDPCLVLNYDVSPKSLK